MRLMASSYFFKLYIPGLEATASASEFSETYSLSISISQLRIGKYAPIIGCRSILISLVALSKYVNNLMTLMSSVYSFGSKRNFPAKCVKRCLQLFLSLNHVKGTIPASGHINHKQRYLTEYESQNFFCFCLS